MKAWVLHDIGDVKFEEREITPPAKNEVQIKVKACGVCGSDIPRIYETGAHKMPLICGHEFSGVVDSLGESVSSDWMGKRVAICPKIPCGKCPNCMNGHPDGCSNYDYSGSRRDGAFAEYVNVPASRLIELPDSAGFEAGAMIEPLAVAANAVRTAGRVYDSKSNEEAVVAVCGMGTIGLMTVMLLKEAGYSKIYVIGNKEHQKAQAGLLGIDSEHFCDSRLQNPSEWLKNKTGGVDIYFECVGSNDSINYGLESGGFGSCLILVGNPRSDMNFKRDTYWEILRNQIKLVGIWNSSFRQTEPGEDGDDDWHFVMKLLAEKRIEPDLLITHRLPIDDLEKGFHIMRDKTEGYIKVMCVMD